MSYIDFHSHAFPNELASTTIPALEKKGNVTAALDGTLSSLLDSMDRADIDISIVCAIVTRPEQFTSVLSWCQEIRSDRIVPFPSFHPESPQGLDQIEKIYSLGFKGVKMHPFYQEFYLDEKRLYPFYEMLSSLGLILIMHTGFDIGFPRDRRADPQKISAVIKQFPDLKFVATHLGAWDQWDEVGEILAGANVYMDIAFALEFLNKETAKDIITAHPRDKILFGSDSPWADPGEVMTLLKGLNLGDTLEKAILEDNARKLLMD